MRLKTSLRAAVLGPMLFLPLFAQTVATVRIDPSRAINSFDPDKAIGSSIDNLNRAAIDKVYTPHILQEALNAGYGPITYRNNTELRMMAWHWNDRGAWSDPESKSGYWTSSSELGEPIRYIVSLLAAAPRLLADGRRRIDADARARPRPTGRAIHTSPVSSRANRTRAIRNG